jgi:hypothetical protein
MSPEMISTTWILFNICCKLKVEMTGWLFSIYAAHAEYSEDSAVPLAYNPLNKPTSHEIK